MDSCFIPALFMTGDDDDFVGPHHTKAIFEKYAGDKQMLSFPGGHNGSRPDEAMFRVGEFFYQVMQCDLIQQKMTEDRLKQQEEVKMLREKMKNYKQPQQDPGTSHEEKKQQIRN